MKLGDLAESFLITARQLNLLVRPHIRVVHPIPQHILPRLLELSNGVASGSPMEFAISMIKSKDPISKNYTAILAILDSSIIGWALVRLDPSPTKQGSIDIFVDPAHRKQDIGGLLRFEADKYIRDNNHTPDNYDHFAPYKEEHLSDNTILQQQLLKTHARLSSLLHDRRNLTNAGLSKKEFKARLTKIDEEIRQTRFTLKDMLEDEKSSNKPVTNPLQTSLPI